MHTPADVHTCQRVHRPMQSCQNQNGHFNTILLSCSQEFWSKTLQDDADSLIILHTALVTMPWQRHATAWKGAQATHPLPLVALQMLNAERHGDPGCLCRVAPRPYILVWDLNLFLFIMQTHLNAVHYGRSKGCGTSIPLCWRSRAWVLLPFGQAIDSHQGAWFWSRGGWHWLLSMILKCQ